MTWEQWKSAMEIVALINLGVAVFGIVIWRLAKSDEHERRDREEGPTNVPSYRPTSRFSGSAH